MAITTNPNRAGRLRLTRSHTVAGEEVRLRGGAATGAITAAFSERSIDPTEMTVLFTPAPWSLLPILFIATSEIHRPASRATSVGATCLACVRRRALPEEGIREPFMDARTLVATDLAALIHPLHHPADHQAPVVFVEGHGAVLRDADGREDLDGLASLWNVNVGHGRAELAEAAAAQMKTLAYASAYTGYTNAPAVRLAERLLRVAYANLSGVYFTTGGAESNETAFKIARYFWRRQGRPGKTKIISRIHGYHGLTLAAMSATVCRPSTRCSNRSCPVSRTSCPPTRTGIPALAPLR